MATIRNFELMSVLKYGRKGFIKRIFKGKTNEVMTKELMSDQRGVLAEKDKLGRLSGRDVYTGRFTKLTYKSARNKNIKNFDSSTVVSLPTSSAIDKIYNQQENTVNIKFKNDYPIDYTFNFKKEDTLEIINAPSPGSALWIKRLSNK